MFKLSYMKIIIDRIYQECYSFVEFVLFVNNMIMFKMEIIINILFFFPESFRQHCFELWD